MLKRSDWKTKSVVFASLISFVLLPFYPTLGLAQDAAPDKTPPKKIELAQASGGTGAGTGAGASDAGAGASSGLSPAVIYGIIAGVVVIGAVAIAASSGSGGNNATAQH